MSIKGKLFVHATALAAVVAFSGFTMAQDGGSKADTPADQSVKTERQHGHKHGGHHRRGMRRGGKGGFGMLRGINLTDDQKTQIHSIFEANKPNPENFQEMRTIMKAKRSGTITADQQSRLQAMHDERKAKADAMKQQIEAILTPEQKAQIETRKQEMKQRRQEWRERRQKQKQAEPATEGSTEKEG